MQPLFGTAKGREFSLFSVAQRLPGADLGQPDGGLDRFNLTEEWADTPKSRDDASAEGTADSGVTTGSPAACARYRPHCEPR
jgi:hypothetical protein